MEPQTIELAKENDNSLTRRGARVYTSNPSIPAFASKVREGIKYRKNERGESFTIIRDGTGEVIEGGAVFMKEEYVDKERFVKLFSDAVESVAGLTGTGKRLFKVLYQMMLDNKNTDEFYLNPIEVQRYAPISKTTYHEAIRELIAKSIIFPSIIPGKYFVNIEYLYNGNRLVKIIDYRCRELSPQLRLTEEPAED